MELTGMIVGFILLANTAISFVSSESLGCEPRNRPENGQVVFTASKNWRRAVEVYQCDSGYTLTGQTKHTCVEGEWSGHVPSCTRNSDASYNNNIDSAQGWFSFRRMLKHKTKDRNQNNDNIPKKKSIGNETSLQTSEYTFQLPKDMIRDLAKEYLISDYDMSCLFRKRHGKKFLRAPKLPKAQVVKYLNIDAFFKRKKNTAQPNNKYLEAVYHCVRGYIFENPSQNRLYCSNGHWVGVKPSCISKTTPMTAYQMECYIKCPRDKNVSLAEGATSVEFSVEPPDTNYDWNKFGSLSSGWKKNSSTTLVPGLYVITYTVRDQEDADIASCRTTVRVTDDQAPTVEDCPVYLELIEDFSKKDTVPVSWPEPRFTDNIAVTQLAKTMEPGQLLGPGLYTITYMALDASANEAECSFTIEIKDRATLDVENRKDNATLNEVI